MTLPVSEDQIRTLVRDVLRRRTQAGPQERGRPLPPPFVHASHWRLPMTSGRDAGGPCLIEPAVSCNHCGFCQSFGH